MARYVAYTDLGKGSGAPVDPDEFGGEDSAEFQYMLARRTVLPEGDRDAPPLPPQYAVEKKALPNDVEKKPTELSDNAEKSSDPPADVEKPATPTKAAGSAPVQTKSTK